MMRAATGVLISFALGCLAGNASGQHLSQYLPIEPGNTWRYFELLEPPLEPPDTIWTGQFTVGAEVVVNDTTYYPFAHRFALADLVRTDSAGRIFGRLDDRDHLLYDFTAPDNTPYEFPFVSGSPMSDSLMYDVTVTSSESCSVTAGKFSDCKRFDFHAQQVIDGDAIYVFARGVGLVEAGGFTGWMELESGTVGGSVITDVDELHRPELNVAVSAGYPNPFRESVTFDLSAGSGRLVDAAVYDLTGRLVERLDVGRIFTERVSWKPADLPSGVYVVHFTGARGDAARRVIFVSR